MNILFDQDTPVPLRRHLVGHIVATAYERGWCIAHKKRKHKEIDHGCANE